MLPRFLLPGLLAICASVLPGYAHAETAPPTAAELEQAQAWVEQLGDASYEAREEAAEQLRELGPPVAGVLEAGLDYDDLEVRCRCQRLLSEIYVLARERRIEDFIAGRVNDEEDMLPCWGRLKETLGEGEASRQLYVLMMQSEWELLESVAGEEDTAFVKMRERCNELQMAYRMYQQEVPLGSLATLLFIAADDGNCPQQVNSALYSFCFQNPFGQTLSGEGEHAATLRALLGRWVENRNDESNPYESLMLAMRYDLPEGLVPARSYLVSDTLPVQVKQLAIVTIAKLGDESDLEALEPHLEDASICAVMQTGQDRIETQLRDVAIVAQIYLRDQNPSEFGFERVQGSGYMLYNPATVGFVDEEERQEAYAKWQEFCDANPLDAPETAVEPVDESAGEE